MREIRLLAIPIFSLAGFRLIFTIVFLSLLLPYDISIFYALNGLAAIQPVGMLAMFLTLIGGEIALALVAGGFWLASKSKSERLDIPLVIIFTIALSDLAVLLLKTAYFRPRPFQILSGVLLPMGPDNGSSFPSGHTARSFAVSTFILLKKGGRYFPLVLLSVGVALSRVIIGVHFPLDVTAGALLGIIVGVASFQYGKRTIDFLLRHIFAK
ncbi:MAG TPA: phosphatase PAP2 family protein [Candidatus Bathyarchaeia archaeon]|nr:phosphatase PAP2 family protein [Candidatus Bathyarchaeia archaeon]